MPTIGEKTGGRNGFSCERPVLTSEDKKKARKIAEKKKGELEEGVSPDYGKLERRFRIGRD